MRGNKDCLETTWVTNVEELAGSELAPPPQRGKAAHMDIKSYEGKLRKTSCSSFGMGMKVRPAIVHAVHIHLCAVPAAEAWRCDAVQD